MGACIQIPAPITADAASVGLLLEGIRQLGLAVKEIQEFRHGTKSCNVEFVVQDEHGIEIGIQKTADNQLQFLVDDKKADLKNGIDTINKIKQVYSRAKVLSELKKKGYQSVKEEKLPDGTIKLVLSKWQ